MTKRITGDDGELLSSDTETYGVTQEEKVKRKRSDQKPFYLFGTFWVTGIGFVLLSGLIMLLPALHSPLFYGVDSGCTVCGLLQVAGLSISASLWKVNRPVAMGFCLGVFAILVLLPLFFICASVIVCQTRGCLI